MNIDDGSIFILILFSPLAAAFVGLIGKLFCGNTIFGRMPPPAAFVIWFGGAVSGIACAWTAVIESGILSYHMGGWNPPFGISLELDGIGLIMVIVSLLIASAVWFQTRRCRGRFSASFDFFFFLALFALQGILLTRDLFNLFVWFEVLSLCSFVLIAWSRSPVSLTAAVRYLLISSVSIFLFLLGLWILYMYTGTLSLRTIGVSLEKLTDPAARRSVGAAIALLTAGVLTRSAIIPFHSWLPEAHSAAPYPVSAFLSGFVIKVPVIALWRIFEHLPFPALGTALLWLGSTGALFGAFAAMVQKDAKKLLAYSSVSQMGFIIAAFGFGGPEGRGAAFFYIIAHALFKSLLFLTLGEATERAGNRNIHEVRGLLRFFPYQGILFLLAAASIAGVPFLSGYSAKLLISHALYSNPAYFLLYAAGIGTVASYFKVGRIFFGKTGRAESDLLKRLPEDYHSGRFRALPARLLQTVLAVGIILQGAMSARLLNFFSGFGDLGFSTMSPHSTVEWFTHQDIAKAVFSLAAGLILSLLLFSKGGRVFSSYLRRCSVDLNGSLRLLVTGFIVFSLVGIFFYP